MLGRAQRLAMEDVWAAYAREGPLKGRTERAVAGLEPIVGVPQRLR